jgi:multisubunit Na+/H+ antiporter MnhG subunit
LRKEEAVNQKQIFLMLATCVAVIALAVIMVSIFGVGISALFLGLAILCPLSHLLMMRAMGNNHGSVRKQDESMKPDLEHSTYAVPTKSEENRNVQNCH